MKTTSKFSVLLALSLALGLLFGLAPQAVSAADQCVNPGGTDGCHSTIQSAVDAAGAGETVTVYAGTYTGPVTITKDLTLLGTGNPVIQAIDNMPVCFHRVDNNTDYRAVVCVKDAVVTIDGIVVDGLGKGSTNSGFMGVVYNNAGGTFQNSTIKDIRYTPLNGVQNLIGLYLYNNTADGLDFDLLNNTITGFQKNAVTINGTTMHLTTWVDGNTITGAGPTAILAQNGIQTSGVNTDATISNNIISGITYDGANWVASSILAYNGADITDNNITGAHMAIYNMGGGTISGNVIDVIDGANYAYGIGVYPDGATPQTALVSGNIITYSGDTDVQSVGIDAYAGNTAPGQPFTVSLLDNQISGFTYGMSVDGYPNGVYGPINITGNILDNDTDLYLGGPIADGNIADISNNQLGSFYSGLAFSTDLEGNWWGSVLGPDASAITGTADFSPWCTNAGCTAFAQQSVIASESIQAAIDAAAPGDIIMVGPGTYNEWLTINKPDITLRSADGAAATIINATGQPANGVGIDVLANMGVITIDGFTVTNFGESGIVQRMSQAAGTTLHVLNNIITPRPTYLRNGIQVSGNGSTVIGNTVTGAPLTEDWASTAIHVAGGSNVLVEGNTVNDGGGDGLGIGIGVTQWYAGALSNVTVRNNTVTGAYDAVRLTAFEAGASVSDVTVVGNQLTAYENSGLSYDGDGTIAAPNAEGNWWGSANGPSLIAAGVDYNPWCTDATCATQAHQGIWVEVVPTTVQRTNTFTAQIRAESNALYGIEAHLTFDATRLAVTGVSLGSGLQPDFVGINQHGAGTIDIAYTQAAPHTAVTGNSILLATLTFQAKVDAPLGGAAIGFATAVTPQTILAGDDGFALAEYPGALDVAGDSIDITAETELHGVVRLQGRPTALSSFAGVNVNLSGGTLNAPLTFTTLDTGVFDFPGLDEGTYTLQAAFDRYLPASYTGLFGPQSFTGISTTLLGGNAIYSDNVITDSDLSFMGARFLLSPTDGTPQANADINGDGVVNILDLTLGGVNFGKISSLWTLP